MSFSYSDRSFATPCLLSGGQGVGLKAVAAIACGRSGNSMMLSRVSSHRVS